MWCCTTDAQIIPTCGVVLVAGKNFLRVSNIDQTLVKRTGSIQLTSCCGRSLSAFDGAVDGLIDARPPHRIPHAPRSAASITAKPAATRRSRASPRHHAEDR